MKILVVCQYYYPENFQINEICKQLVADGHYVTVLTGLPNYPTGVIQQEYKHGKKRNEVIDGVHVIRRFEIGRGKGAFRLALNYISYCASATSYIGKLDNDFDIVFVYQLSPVLMGIPGLAYSRKHNVPTLFYCCDLWPESMKLIINDEHNLVFKFTKRISNKIYRTCDRIIVQSKSFIDYFTKTHEIDKCKLTYIPQFANDDYLNMDFTPSDNIVDFVFMGNVGIAQNLDAVIRAVEKNKDLNNFKLHIIGDGSCLENLRSLVKEKRLDKFVEFYGRRPVEEMTNYYALADVCLVSLRADNLTGHTLPSKVQGYMAAGKTIIGMINGSAKDVINESGCGVCVDASDEVSLAEAMRDYIQNTEKYCNCGERGRQYFKEYFSKNSFMDALYKEFEVVRR